ncbi:MAG TPA: PAS domain-containing sensor histidine kinase [Acidimicrobiia bacterium]|nr:PAS domain-containing sensor histidine kinase [Acidimicrobiia bacterium]
MVAAKSTAPWGPPSPALGVAIGGSFHGARALSGLIAACGFGLLAFSWGWWEGWQLSLFSLAVAAHGLHRKTHPERSLVISLAVDLFWLAAIFLAGEPPVWAFIPGLCYIVVAGVLALDGWRAGVLVISAMSLFAAAAFMADLYPSTDWSVPRQWVLVALAVAIHLPTMTWLISSSTRLLRSRQQLSESLIEKEGRLRVVTDNASDGIVAFDEEGRITFANRTLDPILGFRPTDVIGSSIDRLLPTIDRASIRASRETINLSLLGLHRLGHEVALEVTIGRTREKGAPLYVAVMRDVSNKRAVFQRIEFQAALLDQVRTMVVAADLDGRLIYVNANAVAALGIRPEQMRRSRLLDLLTDEAREALAGIDVPLEGTWRGETILRGVDGAEVPALATITRIRDADGVPIGLGAIAVDITERKRTEEKLAALLASKDEFVTSVSHELRTPLTVIVGMAQELRSSFDEFSGEAARDLIGVIADQASDLANIVQDLLVIGRSDGGGSLVINRESIAIDEELKACLKLYLPADREIELNLDSSQPVVADALRLRQVLRNLLTNAIRYGGPNLRAIVKQNSLFTTFSLWDDGTGVPPEDVNEIFQPYVRSRSGPALPGSMGLGLAVARKLSQLMGGDLVYERRGEWSVFEMTLPTALVEKKRAHLRAVESAVS